MTNGAEWYVVKGGMQDFNYLFSNCFEITVELSCCKHPLEGDIAPQWAANKDSFLAYIESVKMGNATRKYVIQSSIRCSLISGINGVINDRNGNPAEGAQVIVEGIDKPIRTTSRGEYWRLLTPGTYRVRALGADGFKSGWKTITVKRAIFKP